MADKIKISEEKIEEIANQLVLVKEQIETERETLLKIINGAETIGAIQQKIVDVVVLDYYTAQIEKEAIEAYITVLDKILEKWFSVDNGLSNYYEKGGN